MTEESGNMDIVSNTDIVNNTDRIVYEPTDIPAETLEKLTKLGFEEGELEAFIENPQHFSDFPENLIQKYLDISRTSPYSTNWHTIEDISLSSNIDDRTKRIIAEAVLDSFYNPETTTETIDSNTMDISGGKRRKRSLRKTVKRKTSRKSKKRKSSRKSKRRKSRR